MRFAWIVLIAGCWASPPPVPPQGPSAPGAIVITETGFGPIDGKTVATLVGLRAMLPQFRVVPVNDPALEYQIYDGKEQLAFIVLDDDATIYNIHATSNKVTVAGRAWRAGEAFQHSKDLTRCTCWGNNPTCFKKGEHVAVNFSRACMETEDPRELRVLDGLVIQRVIWSPTAFGTEPVTPPEDEEDGVEGGEAP
ncbi:MAG: hypothetical protein ABI591_19980 [Kofleriaceae bacterium]